MYELSLVELESELAAELPTRNLMSRRRHRRGGTRAWANNGSVANANSTNQTINNAQSAVLTGVNSGGHGLQANAALVAQIGANSNDNHNIQYGVPVNFSN